MEKTRKVKYRERNRKTFCFVLTGNLGCSNIFFLLNCPCTVFKYANSEQISRDILEVEIIFHFRGFPWNVPRNFADCLLYQCRAGLVNIFRIGNTCDFF